MHRTSFVFALVIALSFHVAAQQSGTAERDYTLNGNGSLMTGPVVSTIGTGATVANVYATMDPNQPVIWAASLDLTIGWHQTATNSVDLGPANFIQIGNGADASDPFASAYMTDGTGQFSISVAVPASMASSTYVFQMGHLSPASPDGFYVSQAHQVTTQLDPNLGTSNTMATGTTTPLTLGDDDSVLVPLGFSFTYYGTTYTECYVGSNGYVTFVTGDDNANFDATVLVAEEARICALGGDIDPSAGGTVGYYTDNVSTFEVVYTGVPNYFPPGTDNTFKITLADGAIFFDYGNIDVPISIVGLTPGGGVAPSLPLNLSYGNRTIGSNQSPNEHFDGIVNMFDLEGFRVAFALDATGTPTSQN